MAKAGIADAFALARECMLARIVACISNQKIVLNKVYTCAGNPAQSIAPAQMQVRSDSRRICRISQFLIINYRMKDSTYVTSDPGNHFVYVNDSYEAYSNLTPQFSQKMLYPSVYLVPHSLQNIVAPEATSGSCTDIPG